MTGVSAVTESLYTKRFNELAKTNQKAFIPFTLLGWPNISLCRQTLYTMIDSGVAALELGLPFSDPSADGVVIQQAAVEALEAGFRVDDGFALIADARRYNATIPIGLLVYYNLLLARGVENFVRDYANAGGTGLLIPDLPPEVAQEVAPVAKSYGIDLIFIVSPLTTAQRLQEITRFAGGFLYVVSRLGITGTQAHYDETLESLLARLKQHSTLPRCVGFGISTPQQAQQIIALGADGVITGSRIIELIGDSDAQDTMLELSAYLADMFKAVQPG